MIRNARVHQTPWTRSSLSSQIPLRRTLNTHVHYSDDRGGFFTPSPPADSTSSPSSSPPRFPHNPNNGRGGKERVSDHEYNVRVGRAFDLLRATMPDFMRTGLVDYHHDQSSQSSALTLLDVFTFRALRAKTTNNEVEEATSTADQVYDSAIHFRFCPAPPSSSSTSASSVLTSSSTEPDLTEEEAASLSFSGRSLYFASAHVLRHTLNVLFTHSKVEVKKIRLECKGDQPRIDDVLHLRFEFVGHLRMTGQEHNYTLIFRYDFDPDTGRIIRHTVEKVEPAIGRKLWTGIATVWQRLIGHEPSPIPTACHVRMQNSDHMQGERRVSGLLWGRETKEETKERQ